MEKYCKREIMIKDVIVPIPMMQKLAWGAAGGH